MYRLIVSLCLFIGLSASPALAQTTRVVDDDGHGAAASCDDPAATFATVGAAITAAAAGDTVLVCPGTYVENINFGGKAIVVRSAAGGAATILDGNAIDSVVTFASGETSTSVLEGFTIRNGSAQSFGGGGIRISSASPVIRRNLIVGNRACQAPGIFVTSGSPLIEENTIANNVLNCGGGTIGGGITVFGNSPVIRRNYIYNHTGLAWGGGIALWSGGSPTVEFNVIIGNSATNGGGIAVINDSRPLIKGNLIVRNEAQLGAGIYWSILSNLGGILAVNNTIADNSAIDGSGVFAENLDQNSLLSNNIIVAAPGQTAVFCKTNAPHVPTFHSNDVFSATGAAYGGICTDQTGLNGNISADPLFVEPATNDYHLLPGSPAIDVGNSAATGLPASDLDGHARILDGNGDAVAVVDIGADEAPSSGSAPDPFGKGSPTNAAQGLTRTVLLTWTASAGATGYEYCYDKIDNNACDGTWIPAWSATGATLFGLQGATTFFWQVRAVNGASVTYANGTSSSYWSFTTEVPVLSRIIALSGNLDFGTLLAGRSASRTLTISNTGTDPLTVSGLTSPNGFSAFFSGTIAAGGSRTVTVSFFPNTAGTYGGTINVNGDQTDGTSSIAVSGSAVPVSRIMTLSGDLTFGSIQAGMTTTRTLTISNHGNDPLNVFNIVCPNGFSTNWGGTIAPGASQAVTITFAPTIPTTYNGTITVNATQTFGSSTIAVTGVGTRPPGTQMFWENLLSGSLDSWYVQSATVTAKLPLSIGQVSDLNWRVVGTGDLNGDGMPDLVWRHEFDGWVAVWLMNENAVVSTEMLSIDRVADLNWTIRAVGDIDGDGRADLIWQHRTQGWIAAWLMNGSQVVGTNYLSINRVADTDWEVVGAGDTNGDGDADIVWQHRTQGWLAVWSLNGVQVIGAQLLSVPRMPDPAWHIRGVGDFNGDGRADLLWQNDSNGNLGVWSLNGAAVTGQWLLSSARPDINWRIVGPG